MRNALSFELGHGDGRSAERGRILLSGRIRLVHPAQVLPRDPALDDLGPMLWISKNIFDAKSSKK
jgi:hypothetical protein